MAGKPTTQNVIRVAVLRVGVAISGPNADGTKTVAVKNVVSAFGPKNLGKVYCVKVAGDYEFPERFDMRNAESGLWLGTWVVIPVGGIAGTLWDMTTAQQTPDGSKPKPAPAIATTAVTAPSAPIQPEDTRSAEDERAAARIASPIITKSDKLIVGFGGFSAAELAAQISTRPYSRQR